MSEFLLPSLTIKELILLYNMDIFTVLLTRWF